MPKRKDFTGKDGATGRDTRPYYIRKADSTNLDSKPGSRKRDARRCDDVSSSEFLPRIPDGGGDIIAAYQQEAESRALRRIQNLDSFRASALGYGQAYVSVPIVYGSFICPRCGKDVRIERWCVPPIEQGPKRFDFDPDTVVDALPNRPELD